MNILVFLIFVLFLYSLCHMWLLTSRELLENDCTSTLIPLCSFPDWLIVKHHGKKFVQVDNYSSVMSNCFYYLCLLLKWWLLSWFYILSFLRAGSKRQVMRLVATLCQSQRTQTQSTATKAAVNRLQKNHMSSPLGEKSASDSMPYFQPKDYVIWDI